MLLLGGVHLSLTQRIAGRWRGAGILWSTAALTRPEGATIFAVHWGTGLLARLWARRRGDTVAGGVLPAHAIADIVCVVLVVGSHFALRYLLYEGELLPNTYYAKAGGLLGLTPWGYIRGGALAPFFGAVGVGLGVAGWWRLRPLLPLAAPLLALAVGGAGLPWVVGPDWMLGWRFAVPFLPALAIVVVFGWFAWLTPWLERRRLGGRRAGIRGGGDPGGHPPGRTARAAPDGESARRRFTTPGTAAWRAGCAAMPVARAGR